MSEPTSITSGVAGRYATAVFAISKDEKKLTQLEKDVSALDAALCESSDLIALISSPIYTRAEMAKAISAVADKMKLSAVMKNTLGLMAQKRRLFVVPDLLNALRALLAAEKGEVTAEVTSAKALTKTQSDKLAKTLKAQIGKTVNINATVDQDIIGGLIVKVGSKMIDTSLRSKLNALQNSMKEVG